jgi:predicted Zn-dependent protease
MGGRLHNWFLFPVRHPGWALGAALLLGGLIWYGLGILQFRRNQAAAEQAIAKYDFPTARRLLAQCIQWRPRDPALRLLNAQAARRDGDLDAAQEQLDFHRELVKGDTSERTLELALLSAQRGSVEEVVTYLISCLDAHHPASEQILEALAVGCVSIYHLNRARFWLQELLERVPHNPIGQLIRAQMSETMGSEPLALERLRNLVADFPNYDQARQFLADLLLKRLLFDEAAGHYEVLRRRQPGQLAPLLGLARCRDRIGRSEEARPLMRELEERYGDNSDALLECGKFALHDNRLIDAERLLRRALELAPYNRDIYLHLGTCLEQLGKTEESRRCLQRHEEIEADMIRLEKAFEAMVKAPTDPEPHFEAGQICLRNRQDQEALRWFRGVLQLNPNHKPTHQALADYYASHGDSQRAAYHRQRGR